MITVRLAPCTQIADKLVELATELENVSRQKEQQALQYRTRAPAVASMCRSS